MNFVEIKIIIWYSKKYIWSSSSAFDKAPKTLGIPMGVFVIHKESLKSTSEFMLMK